jgi:hypothetical protein
LQATNRPPDASMAQISQPRYAGLDLNQRKGRSPAGLISAIPADRLRASVPGTEAAGVKFGARDAA